MQKERASHFIYTDMCAMQNQGDFLCFLLSFNYLKLILHYYRETKANHPLNKPLVLLLRDTNYLCPTKMFQYKQISSAKDFLRVRFFV